MHRRFTNYDQDGVATVTYNDVIWQEVRQNRDRALKESDWRAVKDRVLPNAWKDYRQALRDLPQDYAEANDAADNWPVLPDE